MVPRFDGAVSTLTSRSDLGAADITYGRGNFTVEDDPCTNGANRDARGNRATADLTQVIILSRPPWRRCSSMEPCSLLPT